MKHKIFLATIAFFITSICIAQENRPNSESITYQSGFSAETFYHSGYGIAFGGILARNVGYKSNPNYSIGIYGDVLLTDTPIIGPRVKLNYNYLGIFGLNLNFSNYFRNGVNDFRITPEINFSVYGTMNLFAGYSFNVSNESLSDLNEFRLGINLVLVNKSKF